jgi:cell division GTPase FtsZ
MYNNNNNVHMYNNNNAQGVIGISDIIIQPGLINVDFADVRSVLLNAGSG